MCVRDSTALSASPGSARTAPGSDIHPARRRSRSVHRGQRGLCPGRASGGGSVGAVTRLPGLTATTTPARLAPACREHGGTNVSGPLPPLSLFRTRLRRRRPDARRVLRDRFRGRQAGGGAGQQLHRAAVHDRAQVLARRALDQVRFAVAGHVQQSRRTAEHVSGLRDAPHGAGHVLRRAVPAGGFRACASRPEVVRTVLWERRRPMACTDNARVLLEGGVRPPYSGPARGAGVPARCVEAVTPHGAFLSAITPQTRARKHHCCRFGNACGPNVRRKQGVT